MHGPVHVHVCDSVARACDSHMVDSVGMLHAWSCTCM